MVQLADRLATRTPPRKRTRVRPRANGREVVHPRLAHPYSSPQKHLNATPKPPTTRSLSPARTQSSSSRPEVTANERGHVPPLREGNDQPSPLQRLPDAPHESNLDQTTSPSKYVTQTGDGYRGTYTVSADHTVTISTAAIDSQHWPSTTVHAITHKDGVAIVPPSETTDPLAEYTLCTRYDGARIAAGPDVTDELEVDQTTRCASTTSRPSTTGMGSCSSTPTTTLDSRPTAATILPRLRPRSRACPRVYDDQQPTASNHDRPRYRRRSLANYPRNPQG